jgi:toxin ParE1/3/4
MRSSGHGRNNNSPETGSFEVANRLIDSITDRFFLLPCHPHLGRARDDFGVGARSLPVGEYVIIYCLKNSDVLILRVAHGRREFPTAERCIQLSMFDLQ